MVKTAYRNIAVLKYVEPEIVIPAFCENISYKKKLHLSKSLEFNSSFKQELAYNLDFVRYTSLELCANEIKVNNVQGNIAELGVYKGEFAKKIKPAFPHEKNFTCLILLKDSRQQIKRLKEVNI